MSATANAGADCDCRLSSSVRQVPQISKQATTEVQDLLPLKARLAAELAKGMNAGFTQNTDHQFKVPRISEQGTTEVQDLLLLKARLAAELAKSTNAGFTQGSGHHFKMKTDMAKFVIHDGFAYVVPCLCDHTESVHELTATAGFGWANKTSNQ